MGGTLPLDSRLAPAKGRPGRAPFAERKATMGGTRPTAPSLGRSGPATRSLAVFRSGERTETKSPLRGAKGNDGGTLAPRPNFSAGSWTETALTRNAGILLLTVSCHNAAAEFATRTQWHYVNHDRF
jgi:hypothetical protein